MQMFGQNILGKRKGKSKGPEVPTCLVDSKTIKVARLPGEE